MSVTVAYKQTVNGIKDNHSPEVVTLEELFNNKKQMATTQNYSEEDEYLLSTFYDIVSVIRDPIPLKN